MAVGMFLTWPGVTREQYETVRASVNWEGGRPDGGNFHACSFGDDGMHIFDIWDSPEAFQRFQEDRLSAGIAAAGIEGEPQVEFYELHATYAPAFAAA